MKTHFIIVVLGICVAAVGQAKTIRATDLNGTLLSKLSSATLAIGDELVIEFRQGDQLPVSTVAKGDLLETVQVGVSQVNVKRNFWLKVKVNEVLLSLDGLKFKPIKETLEGKLLAGAASEEGSGIANAIELGFEASIK